MFRISDRSTRKCIVIEVEGALTGDDYEKLEDTFEDATDKTGRTNLVVNLLGSIKYGDRDALEEDFEFAFKDYKKVRRAAFVGDQKLVVGMMKVFSPFTRTEERFFEPGDLDAAISWASEE